MTATLNKLDFNEFKIPGLIVPELAIVDDETPPLYISPDTKRKQFLHDIAITGISGDEGDGKSLLMTKFAWDFYKMGGEVLAFPGYELKDDDGKVVSKTLEIEHWARLDPKTLKDKLVAIDEIEDFFDAQMWQSVMVKIFTGVFGQRRHLNTGIIYTLQYFNELPRLMRQKTRFVIQCKDAANYNDVRQFKETEGTKTYTTIMDNHGKKNLHLRGMTYRGPTYHNQKHWDHYSTEKNPDIMSKFTKINVKRKVIEVDLNGDGQIDENEKIQTQKLFDMAKISLVNAFEKKGTRGLKGVEYWAKAQLDQHKPAHQAIAAQLNEDLGIEKDWQGVYKRDYSLINK